MMCICYSFPCFSRHRCIDEVRTFRPQIKIYLSVKLIFFNAIRLFSTLLLIADILQHYYIISFSLSHASRIFSLNCSFALSTKQHYNRCVNKYICIYSQLPYNLKLLSLPYQANHATQ